MLLPGIISPRTWLLFVVIVSFIVLSETIENNRLNINVGFDLKQEIDGDLHIRNLKDSSEVNRRAGNDDSDENAKRPKGKDSSDSSDSDESRKKHSDEKPNHKNSDKSDSSSEENDSIDKLHSTRGLRPDEYEPEDSAKIHARYKGGDDDDSDGSSRRRKRSIQASKNQKYLYFSQIKEDQ